ncbi:dephospho-CoA kinase [Pueribacillus theae]|uniref:Dephospho-CoA kinase n=1 Tax=Pueribacillus theae TaxID=2171751 RepID=A0A2U1JJW4_9BACI|nr:dephospho-CoA kinase [Pueribacillus theae]PWA05460.1 dephospho-CoA kinase [Pueribacillus theae]
MIIGLTGGIASGKSTVAGMFEELGIPVVDADMIARKVVEPGEEAYRQIIAHFGKSVLFPDGTLNRKKLGSIVFKNEKERLALNNIIHPAVREKMDEEKNDYLAKGHQTVVLDIPLLFEGRDKKSFDKILLVAVSEDVQFKRLVERDQMGEEDAANRIQSQMPIKDKIPLSDAVIYNDGTIEETKEQLLTILEKWGVN